VSDNGSCKATAKKRELSFRKQVILHLLNGLAIPLVLLAATAYSEYRVEQLRARYELERQEASKDRESDLKTALEMFVRLRLLETTVASTALPSGEVATFSGRLSAERVRARVRDEALDRFGDEWVQTQMAIGRMDIERAKALAELERRTNTKMDEFFEDQLKR
jgi:hypothetical protein